jgi:hypothetical protein
MSTVGEAEVNAAIALRRPDAAYSLHSEGATQLAECARWRQC